jgi:hypothetical protein
MKYLIWISILLLCANPLFAQQPTISYLMCDEAKSQLQIHGSFGVDSGSVSIEDTTLGIVSWSDSLIICNLPDSGKGAGGNVVVQTAKGVSNKRVLSIFQLDIYDGRVGYESNGYVVILGEYEWYCNWRADISTRPSGIKPSFSFEISKTSFGTAAATPTGMLLHWRDSSLLGDTSISVKGTLDIDSDLISLSNIYMGCGFPQQGSATGDKLFIPSTRLQFDSLGHVYTVRDSFAQYDEFTEDYYNVSGDILFPPGLKSKVLLSSISNADQVNIFATGNQINIQSQSPLGATTASLYTIDGRLLKRTKLDISSPGEYTLDVSDLHTHFAILVLQMAKGVITRKILF